MATLGIVKPEDWITRTGLGFGHDRGAELQQVDAAYAAYYATRSEADKRALNRALEHYLRLKGGYWEKVRRNSKSDGLMKHIYEATREQPIAKTMLDLRIPETRHGVMYLWYQAEVKAQLAKIALEGALGVAGSATTMLSASSYSKGESLEHLGVIEKKSTAAKAIKGSKKALALGKKAGVVPKSKGVGVKNPSMIPKEERAPIISLSDLPDDPSAMERAKQVFGTAFNYIYEKIRDAVEGIFESLKAKYHSIRQIGVIDTVGAGTIGGSIYKLITFIIGKVAKHAAPLAGNIMEIAQGIGKSFIAAKDRIVAYQKKSRFVIMPGHPAKIGEAIEKEMNWAIARGVYDVAKGGAKLAGNIASWGASALIDVIAACVEFAWKFLSRIIEARSMTNWIEEVRNNYGEMQSDPSDRDVLRPAIVFDDERFVALFERGCSASPCVPMLTLNSGVAGDQMMFMRMFDDTGGILNQKSAGSRPTADAQKQFDSATEYWSHLKTWGSSYLSGTGFTFTSADKTANGLLWHGIAHHQAPGKTSFLDKVLHVLAGA